MTDALSISSLTPQQRLPFVVAAVDRSSRRTPTGNRTTREAGLLAPGSLPSFAFPRPKPRRHGPQWHFERSLAGHSCGGSRGLVTAFP